MKKNTEIPPIIHRMLNVSLRGKFLFCSRLPTRGSHSMQFDNCALACTLEAISVYWKCAIDCVQNGHVTECITAKCVGETIAFDIPCLNDCNQDKKKVEKWEWESNEVVVTVTVTVVQWHINSLVHYIYILQFIANHSVTKKTFKLYRIKEIAPIIYAYHLLTISRSGWYNRHPEKYSLSFQEQN